MVKLYEYLINNRIKKEGLIKPNMFFTNIDDAKEDAYFVLEATDCFWIGKFKNAEKDGMFTELDVVYAIVYGSKKESLKKYDGKAYIHTELSLGGGVGKLVEPTGDMIRYACAFEQYLKDQDIDPKQREYGEIPFEKYQQYL